MKTNIENAVTDALRALADEGYRDFQATLIPNLPKERFLGVRMPVLRKYAASFAKSTDAEVFLNALPHESYDENNLHALLIGKISDFEQAKAALDRFLPYVDNWATCDMISPEIFRRHPESRVRAIKEWLSSDHAYTVRCGIVLLMKYDLDKTFRPEYTALVATVHHENYYVKMAQAWYFATALATQYEAVLPYLTEKRLEPWVHTKAIQKAIESYRISPEHKAFLRTLRHSKSVAE